MHLLLHLLTGLPDGVCSTVCSWSSMHFLQAWPFSPRENGVDHHSRLLTNTTFTISSLRSCCRLCLTSWRKTQRQKSPGTPRVLTLRRKRHALDSKSST